MSELLPVKLTQTYEECKSSDKSTSECILETINTGAKERATEIIEGISHGVSRAITKTVIAVNAIDYANSCIKDGKHSVVACEIGAIVRTGTEVSVDGASAAMAIASRTAKTWPVLLGSAAVGAVNSQKIGKDFGNLTVRLVDYLIDHVPAEAIDTAASITLTSPNGQDVIEFEPKEVKFIQKLVEVNQITRRESQALVQSASGMSDRFEMYKTRLEGKIQDFNEITRRVEIKLDRQLDIVREIENQRLRLQELTPRLEQKLETKFVDLHEEANRHNQKNVNSIATVEYDGEWKIGIQIRVNVGGGFGGGSGGGFSCNIL